jgi:hypothetical protein
MRNEREFDNILNECMERVMRGEDIQSCLARYPEYADDLEPLLKTVFDAKQAVDIGPRPEFRQRAAYEFQTAIRNMPVKESRGFSWRLSWVMPVAIVLVVLAAGSGTVVAANNSLPDQPLYKVKKATEAVQIAFTPSDMGKAELYAKFADRRVEEIVKLADKGEAKQIDEATDRMNSQLIAMANITSNNVAVHDDTGPAMLQAPASATYESADTQAKQAPVASAQMPPTAPSPIPASTPTQTAEPNEGSEPPVTITVPPPPETIITSVPAPVITIPPEESTGTTPPDVQPLPAARSQAPMLTSPETPFIVEESGSGALTGSYEKDGKLDRQEKLKRILSDRVREHLEKLQEELEKAPDDLKPAIQRAIEVIINGYETNLSNLR